MSGHLRARLDGFLRSQDDHSVFIGSGEKHSLAFHAAELSRVPIGDHNDLPAHEFFRRVMISDTCAYLALFGSQVDLEHQQPIGVGMRLGRFNSCHSEFHISKFINGDHPNLIYRACCLLQEDSRTCSSKKDFGVSGFHASLDNQKQRTIRWGAGTVSTVTKICNLLLREARPAASALPGKDSESYSAVILQTLQREAQDLTKDRVSLRGINKLRLPRRSETLMRHASSNLISGVSPIDHRGHTPKIAAKGIFDNL